ncbi:jg18262 [Pararge aegeria aegeria]|uniref:Jg18262 protein n=1 Tax=Pararge aegeria aegeria TaxID=348720 RepID=A0A8S4S816_9NEOP|nr:jg18262 [Pararge aegeria aegeria]
MLAALPLWMAKLIRWPRFSYLRLLACSALVAAAPTIDEVAWMCDAARVSTQVASHRSDLPSLQGISVIPSGLLPLLRAKPIVLIQLE